VKALRRMALALITATITATSLVSFAESYRGLFTWAAHHGLHGAWAVIWPLQVDTFIAVGELALFVALADRWSARNRTGAWAVTVLGLAVSVAGNVGHAAGHDWATRLTAAVPPMAAAAALAVGLGVLKRVVAGAGADLSAQDAGGHLPAEHAPRQNGQTGHSGHRRRTQPRRMSMADQEAAALVHLAEEPQMSGAELARRLRVSEKTARRVRARLAGPDN